MSSGYPAPVQTQPQWGNGSTLYLSQFSKPTPVVPPGLEYLVEEEEVILKDTVFQTKDGRALFSVDREPACCTPLLNLRLRDPHRRDMVYLCLDTSTTCCGGESILAVQSPSVSNIGFVIIACPSTYLSVTIQNGDRKPVFCATVPVNMDSCSSTIPILSIDGSHPVASITKEKEGDSSQVIFRFPMDMAATLKAVILAAFLYMTYRMQQVSTSNSYSDDGWAFAGVYWGGEDFGGGGGDIGGGGDSGCGDGGWGGGDGGCGGGDGGCGGGDGGCGGGDGGCGGD
ncbi:phospholipid scramblase 3-like [Hyperolius riggenbachi]|uniref:phospholipid scramblase 3-like n=1 Tax=Hyperolius riggenbachi TaxID=752182 RepID=UPI0035A2FA32